jgi:hypothetical protein
VSDIILDDGVEQQRHCGVEAELDGQKVVFTVPAVEFAIIPDAAVAPARPVHAVNQMPVRKRQTESRSRPATRFRLSATSLAVVA